MPKQSSNQPEKLPQKIGLCGFFGYGNLGNAAIQRAVIANIRKRIPDAQIFGFSLNPEDTQQRHQIPSFSIVRRPNPAAQCGNNGRPKPSDQTTTAASAASHSQAPPQQNGIKAWLKSKPALFNALKSLKKPLDFLRMLWDEFVYCRKCYKILKQLDTFILSGGGALDEGWGGPWKTPYITFRWAVLARLAGLNFLVLSVGVETLESPLSRFFARRALHLASYRSFRDAYSQAFVRKTCGCEGLLVPDLAFSLEVDPSIEPPRENHNGRPRSSALVVGISPMDYLDPRSWPRKNARLYQEYIQTMAAFSEWLLSRGYSVRFFPSDIHMDRLAILDVMETLRNNGRNYSGDQIAEERVAIVPELVADIAAVDFAVASRFHGVVLSHRMRTPVLALSYDPKVNRLMGDMDLTDYCFTIEHMKLDEMIRAFELLEKNQAKVEEHVKQITTVYRTSLQNQYDQIFGPGAQS